MNKIITCNPETFKKIAVLENELSEFLDEKVTHIKLMKILGSIPAQDLKVYKFDTPEHKKLLKDDAKSVPLINMPRFFHPFYRLEKDEPSGLSDKKILIIYIS